MEEQKEGIMPESTPEDGLLAPTAVATMTDGPETSAKDDGPTEAAGEEKQLEQQQLEISYLAADNSPGLWPEYCNPAYRMPDEIEVKVSLASGDYYFPVLVEKSQTPKKYLGGYRNKVTGRIYHHSNTQTPTENKKPQKDVSKLRTRETQTYEERSLSVQPYRESGTQMERVDLVLDNKRDIEMAPRTYFTSEQLHAKKIEKTIFMQRCWRGYMARCRAHSIRRSNINFQLKQRADRDEFLRLQAEKRDADMQRRLHPQSNDDFAILYTELDEWRRAEVLKIKSTTKMGEERNAAMALLLQEETKSLQSIQKLKIISNRNIHSSKTEQMLELMAKPQKWQLSGGDVALVQTPATRRAKELLDLYEALHKPIINMDSRLDVLLHIKVRTRRSPAFSPRFSSSPSSSLLTLSTPVPPSSHTCIPIIVDGARVRHATHQGHRRPCGPRGGSSLPGSAAQEPRAAPDSHA